MAILIPNMGMPNNCTECPLEYDDVFCRLTGKKLWDDVNTDYTKERRKDCPLLAVPEPDIPSGKTEVIDTAEYIEGLYTKYGPYCI